MTEQKYQEQESIPIKYEKIIDNGTHVTGIARISSPTGEGEFEIRVSGQREAVVQYGETAAIISLSFRPLGEEHESLAEELRNSALAFKRNAWYERLDMLKEMVDQADLDQLADSNFLCQHLQDPDKLDNRNCSTPDWSEDRHIQIRPIGEYEEGTRYRLTFAIDPYVPQGKRDIYEPYVSTIDSTGAKIEATAGDPDLYLYRGNGLRDSSLSAGRFDEVWSSGGYGTWRLHVKGYTNASYIISGDWVLLYNNEW